MFLIVVMTVISGIQNIPLSEVLAEEKSSETMRIERATELANGEQYLFVGGTQGNSSGTEDDIYRAVTAKLHKGSKVDGVLDGAEISGIDFSQEKNSLVVSEENLWKFVSEETGKAALYNQSTGKYLHFSEGNRAISLTEEPVYYEVKESSHHVGGRAVSFRKNKYYLNFSESQNGFCAYDASQYNQNETKDTNQYAFYKIVAEDSKEPDPEIEQALATLLFCSDFQTGSEVKPYEKVEDVPESLTSVIGNISKEIYRAGFKQIDSVLAAGDYTAYIGQYNYDADPTIGIQAFKNTIQKQWPETKDFLFVQGNHDAPSYPFHEGANEYEEYIVYCINTTYNRSEMGGFPWMQGQTGSEKQVEKAAEKLQAYLNQCEENGEMRPIIIMAHLPLHFSGRTSSLYGNGDNLYASYLFDVINSAAENLNIAYIYGHNHSKGWDSYVGGSRVFKQPGDTILIPDFSKKAGNVTDHYLKENLNFTYMNAGYIGYNHDSAAASELTAVVCQIFPDKVVFRRFSKDGMLDIGAEGTYNRRYDDSKLIPREELSAAVESPVIVARHDGITSNITIEDAKSNVGDTITIKASTKNIKNASYKWEIKNPEIAEITADGKTATLFCKKAGQTEIVVKATGENGEEISDTALLHVEYDESAKASASIVKSDETMFDFAIKGQALNLHVKVRGIPEIIGYEWSVSDETVAQVKKQNAYSVSFEPKQKGSVELILSVKYKDLQNKEQELIVRNPVQIDSLATFVRAQKIESGKQYLIINGAGKALTSEMYTASGISCLRPEEIEVDDTSDEIKGNYENHIWRIEETDSGKVTIFNEKANKYLSILQENRNVSMTDQAMELSAETGSFSGGTGNCVGFHNGSMYLNYSKSKAGFCGYSGATIADSNNQFLLYEYIPEKAENNMDKSNLQALIQYTESQIENEKYEHVLPVVKELLEAALAEAKIVNESDNVSQAEIDKAYEKLLENVHLLGYIGNSKELQVLVDVVRGMDLSIYTEESRAAVEETLKAAEDLLAKENVLQEEYNAAKSALGQAIEALEEKETVDKEKLRKLINDAKKYEDHISDYVPNTAEIFTKVLAEARDVLQDASATQEQVNAARDALLQAIFGLRLVPNKDALEDLINKVEKMDLSIYSVNTQKVIKSALSNAKIVMADKNATQEEVDGAVKLLRTSIDKAEGTTTTEIKKPTISEKNQSEEKSAKTGDEASPIGWGLAAVFGMFAVAVVFSEGKKRHQ